MRVVIITLLSTIIILTSQTESITDERDERNIDSHERIIRAYLNVYNSKIRKPRQPAKILNECVNATEVKSTINPKVTLVKKPIPRFTDTDSSEEDYQMKLRNPVKYSDSVEHEDEDFNIDDYDFDVHHDEFAGRGKPLQPRMKVKLNTRRTDSVKTVQERPKTEMDQNKVLPRKVSQPSNKVVRKAVHVIKEDDYDDDFPTSTKSPERERKPTAAISEDDVSNESEDSKEYEGRSFVRTVRSPTSFSNYMDKLGEKTSALMSKLLSYLPIFPQIQLPKN